MSLQQRLGTVRGNNTVGARPICTAHGELLVETAFQARLLWLTVF